MTDKEGVMKTVTTTHRTGAALAALAIACASVAACGSDDEASDTATSGDTTEVVADDTTAATQPAATEPAATEPAATEPAATEPAATEPAATEPAATGRPFIGDLDPAITEPALTFCEAYGNLDEPDGVDQLMALVSDDIVIEDMVLGATNSGRDEVRAYVAGLYDTFAIDDAVCPGDAVVQGASWAAGTYELYAADTLLSQGVAAIKVSGDGLVERQVNFYTPSPDGVRQPNIDMGGGVLSIGSQLCRAWGENLGAPGEAPDPDKILSLMSAEPTIHGLTTLTGVDQIRTFVEGVRWDRNECSLEVQAVQWEAVANRFFDDDTGAVWEGVNVIALDANELVTEHWAFLEVVS